MSTRHLGLKLGVIAMVTAFSLPAMAMSCRDTEIGLASLDFGSGKDVRVCAYQNCFNTRYNGNKNSRVSFRHTGISGELTHLRSNRYRIKFTFHRGQEKSFGQKYFVLKMICR